MPWSWRTAGRVKSTLERHWLASVRLALLIDWWDVAGSQKEEKWASRRASLLWEGGAESLVPAQAIPAFEVVFTAVAHTAWDRADLFKQEWAIGSALLAS
eukprot:s1622_g7.t1